MKTFPEALNIIAAHSPIQNGDIEAAVGESIRKVADIKSRYDGVIAEAMESETVKRILETNLNIVPAHMASLNAFILGLMIGIEMERAE